MSVSLAVGDVRRIAHGPVRRLFVGQFLNALGNGSTLALLIPYLFKVRDIPLSVATGAPGVAGSAGAADLADLRHAGRPLRPAAHPAGQRLPSNALGILSYGFVEHHPARRSRP